MSVISYHAMLKNMIYHGKTALEADVLQWFNSSDHMGYRFFPNGNKIIHAVSHVVDNEVSLRNRDNGMRARMLQIIWSGPWMKIIKARLKDPRLLSVEVHRNGHIHKGNTHRDHQTAPVWIVVVPLHSDGNIPYKTGGTVVISDTAEHTGDTEVVSCDYGNFFVFPAHLRHFRQASSTHAYAMNRRTMFMIFTDTYKLSVGFMASPRSQHSKRKAQLSKSDRMLSRRKT